MKVAFVVYPDFTALDLIGPYEVISRWPEAKVPLRSRLGRSGPVRQRLTVLPTDTPATLPSGLPEERLKGFEPSTFCMASSCR